MADRLAQAVTVLDDWRLGALQSATSSSGSLVIGLALVEGRIDADAAFAGLMTAAGVPVRFQVGEPWWWIFPDGRICLYDDAAKAALGGAPPDRRFTLAAHR